MEATLRVESTLEHNGDGLARFSIALTNGAFSANIGTWAQASENLALASVLQGFPASSDATITYKLGGTGTCELELLCLDRLGHIGVWGTFTADWPVNDGGRHEMASLFMRCEPAAIDAFVSELLGFVPGSRNTACLRGLGP